MPVKEMAPVKEVEVEPKPKKRKMLELDFDNESDEDGDEDDALDAVSSEGLKSNFNYDLMIILFIVISDESSPARTEMSLP